MKKIYVILAFVLSSVTFGATSEQILKIESKPQCYIRTIIQTPNQEINIKADMLFLIGFGDRADNHMPLFDLMKDQGIRVISFDYPTHGESQCSHINLESFTSLSFMAQEIEGKTREDLNRPLFLAGWSAGGLLAIRMIQQNFLAERFIKGVILITPSISMYTFVGGDGIIRDKTLLQDPNPPHFGLHKPKSPFFTPVFATTMKLNAALARQSQLPFHMPVLVMVAGEKLDKYVRTPLLKKWIKKSRVSKNNLQAFQCENSMHEMDNEINPIGPTVRNLIKDFVVDHSAILISNDQTACKSL